MNKANNDAATMVVILRTSEEAKCTSPACAWTYSDTLPDVTSMTPSFDAAADIYKITVAGTGFTGAKEAVSLEIDTWPQGATGALSLTSTEIVFGITNITSGVENSKMFMYFAEGVPKGHATIQAGFILDPKLTSISPSQGSVGGTWIEATIHGVGINTPVGPGGLQLVTADGRIFCDDMKVVSYSKVQCMAKGHALQKAGANCKSFNSAKGTKSLRTLEACEAHVRQELPEAKFFFFKPQDDWHCAPCQESFAGGENDYSISDANTYALSSVISALEVSVKITDKAYACAATDPTNCNFARSTKTTMPDIVSLTKTDTTIVFTGTNFFTSGYTARASFFGVEANEWNDVTTTVMKEGKEVTVITPTETVSVVVNSATQVMATFKDGVPTTSSTLLKPVLWFVKDDSKVKIYAISDQLSPLTNPLSLTSSSSDMQCSFAGGCIFNVIVTPGLMSLMKHRPTDNYVKICENKCIFVESTSTAGNIKCSTPPVSTVYSNENFGI